MLVEFALQALTLTATQQALRLVGAVLEGNRNLYWRLTPEENLEYFGVLKGLSYREARRRGGYF
jgi:ABC-type Na+ transport system ATPase subunit NatA